MEKQDRFLISIRRIAGRLHAIHETKKYKTYVGKDRNALYLAAFLFVALLFFAHDGKSILCVVSGVIVGFIFAVSQLFFQRGYIWPVWERYVRWADVKRLADGDDAEVTEMKKQIEEIIG